MFSPALLLTVLATAVWGAEHPAWTLLVSGAAPGISTLSFDPLSGAVSPLAISGEVKGPSFLAFHPNGRFAYSCSSGDRISAMAIQPDWTFKRLNDVASGGKGNCHVAIDPSGRWVFNACYGSGDMGISAVKNDGSLVEPAQVLKPGVQAHQVFFDPTGHFVFVPCKGSDWIAQYRFNPDTGAITPNQPATVPTAKGAGPRHLAWHPSHRFAYLINELDATLTSLAFDAATGVFTPLQTLLTIPKDFDVKKNTAAAVQVAPSGRFVYASDRGHDSIAIVRLDDDGARLTLVANEKAGGDINFPRCFTLDPSGRWMAVANQKGATVTVLKVDQHTGLLTKTGTFPVPQNPSYVRIIPTENAAIK